MMSGCVLSSPNHLERAHVRAIGLRLVPVFPEGGSVTGQRWLTRRSRPLPVAWRVGGRRPHADVEVGVGNVAPVGGQLCW
jgi:hypothetical protein